MTFTTRIISAAAVLPLAFAAIPAASAQESSDNLRCSAWAMLASEQAEDPEQKRGLGMVMAYFMGRYEADSGQQIGDVMTFEALPKLVGDLEEANKTCQPLAASFGNRLTETGLKLQAAAQARAATRSTGDAQTGR